MAVVVCEEHWNLVLTVFWVISLEHMDQISIKHVSLVNEFHNWADAGIHSTKEGVSIFVALEFSSNPVPWSFLMQQDPTVGDSRRESTLQGLQQCAFFCQKKGSIGWFFMGKKNCYLDINVKNILQWTQNYL